MELERKLLLKKLPEGVSKPELIIQGYLYTKPFELRIRKRGSKCYLTYKSTGDEERQEWEKPIPCWLFEELLVKHVGQIIEKNRYTVKRDGLTYEIDEYIKPQPGLIIAEIEFKDRTEYDTFMAPAWLGETLDVTLVTRYKNKNLANNPEPNMKL